MMPLHHGGATAEDANLVQRFIDSDGGTILGTFLHTFGALLFTAGIALYVYQAHLVKSAGATKSSPSLHLLPYAHGFNLGGIAVNGIGGIMRLYQSDHPRIDQLGTSSWVQLLFVKHLFLVLGVGLAVYLTYRTHILSLRDDAPSLFVGETRRMTGFAWTSFATILLASVLGAFATTQLSPTAAAEDDMTNGVDHNAMGHGGSVLYYDNATGTITGSPVSPGREQAEIDVPANASQLRVELSWTNTQAILTLEMRDPTNQVVRGTVKAAPGRVDFELARPAAGSWTALILSERAVNERYNLVGQATVGSLAGSVVNETHTVNPDPTGRALGFVEINLLMKRNATLTYEWEVVGSTADKLNFNVHLHVGNRVDYPVRGAWNKYSGTYSHNSTEEGVSLMWDNPNATPLQVHIKIEGDFTVHSRAIR